MPSPSEAGFPGPGRAACSQASLSAPWRPVLTHKACIPLTHVLGKTQAWKTVRASLKAPGPSSGSARARPATLRQCPHCASRACGSDQSHTSPPLCPHGGCPRPCLPPCTSATRSVQGPWGWFPQTRVAPTRQRARTPTHTHTHTRVFSTLSPLVTQSPGGASAKAHPAPTHSRLPAP